MDDKGYDYDELFPGRFLKAVEFNGRDLTMVIASVVLEEMPDKKGNKVNKDGERVKVKPLVAFTTTDGRPVEKQLVLNRTNAECLKGMFGRKTGAWVGKRVTFFPVTVEAFGEEKPAIRVRGSPDIADDMVLELQLGQKTRKATMKRTGQTMRRGAKPSGNGKPATPPAPEPHDDQESGGDPWEQEKASAAATEEHEPPEDTGPNDIPY
jgi:hypothetical protein